MRKVTRTHFGNVGRLPELESGRRGLAVIGLLDAYVVATMWYRQKLEKLTAT